MSDEELCRRVARSLVETNATWHQRHMAVIAAHAQNRYEIMLKAMEEENVEPVIIEELVMIGEDRGILKGETEALVAVMRARGFEVDAVTRARVAQANAETLLRWIQRAVTAPSARDVFCDDGG